MKTISHNSTTSSVSVTAASGNDQPQLVATIVPDEQRISFWPQHFRLIPQWVTLEPRVFGWMDRLCEDYCGGIWNLYTLNNGGAFMAPKPDDDDGENWLLFNAMNGNRAEDRPGSRRHCRLSDDVQSSCLSYRVLCHDGPLLPVAGLRPAASGMQRHYAHHRLNGEKHNATTFLSAREEMAAGERSLILRALKAQRPPSL